MKNEIILYQADELLERIEVRLDEETVWLNRQQISLLFGRDIKTIGKHINNVFSEGELRKEVVVANFATTTADGELEQESNLHILQKCSSDHLISYANKKGHFLRSDPFQTFGLGEVELDS